MNLTQTFIRKSRKKPIYFMIAICAQKNNLQEKRLADLSLFQTFSWLYTEQTVHGQLTYIFHTVACMKMQERLKGISSSGYFRKASSPRTIGLKHTLRQRYNVMYQSNRSFNITPPGNPRAFVFFAQFLFKFPPPEAEKLFNSRKVHRDWSACHRRYRGYLTNHDRYLLLITVNQRDQRSLAR